jgi:putative transposase
MSNRAKKRKARYDKRNAKLTNYVENEIHNITKDIIKSNPKGIVMENLNVEDLKSRHWCAKEIHDYSFGKCKVIMENKCNKYGVPFKLAPDKYPSSQICSNCGYSINIGTSTVFKCPNCGLTINRDINAAKNLANLFDSL